MCWADTLVESVHTRPRTLPEEVPALFYSRADVKRFEREAEMEPAPSLSPRRVRWADAVVTQIPVISKRRILKAKHPSRISEVDRIRRPCCSVKVLDLRRHEKEMELAHPRAKRSRNASNEVFFGQLRAQLMAVSPVGDSEDESDSEDDGSDLFFLDNSGSDDESLKLSYSDSEDESDSEDAEMEPAPSLSPRRVRWADAVVTQIPVISKRRILKAKHPSRISEVDRIRRPCCSVKVLDLRRHEKEMELAHPRAKRSRNASNEVFFGQLRAQLMAVSPVGDSEDESDSEDDGSDLFFLDNSGSDDESLKLSYSDSEDESDSEDDGSEWYFSLSPISDNSGYSDDDDVDNRPDDPMDISGNLPLLSISGAAREVPPRETSAKGRRLRKELESSLDGCYWAMRLATRR